MLLEVSSLQYDSTFGIGSLSLYRTIFLRVCLLLYKDRFIEPEHILLLSNCSDFLFLVKEENMNFSKQLSCDTVPPHKVYIVQWLLVAW